MPFRIGKVAASWVSSLSPLGERVGVRGLRKIERS
jgi:hypothetical protein